MVYNSAFKLNNENIAVLWYEKKMCEEGLLVLERNVRISVFNCLQAYWSHIKIEDNIEFTHRASLLPIFKEDEEGNCSLGKLLILGGKPFGLKKEEKLRIVELTT